MLVPLNVVMNKEILNKEIVLLRKYVKQARVHTVRKLVRKIELFNKKKRNDKMKQKCERKASLLVEEILSLKKLKDDDISKFCLLGKQLDTHATSPDPRQRVLTKIATGKVLANQIHKFREKWPDWCDVVPKLLNASVERRKLKKQVIGKIPVQRKTFKTKNKITSNLVDPTANVKGSDYVEDKCRFGMVANDFLSLDSSGKVKVQDEISVSFALRRKSGKKISTQEDMSDLEVGTKQASKNVRTGELQRKKAKPIKHSAAEPSITGSTEDGDYWNDKSHLGGPIVAKDPFFMGVNDSARVEDRVKTPTPDSVPVPTDGLNRRQRRLALHTSSANNKNFAAAKNDVKSKHAKRLNVRNNRIQGPDSTVSLHPSWEAKKRLQEQQTLKVPFQGKKIKFDDD